MEEGLDEGGGGSLCAGLYLSDGVLSELEVSTTWQGGGDFDRSQLPSAPRKAQARNIDRSRLPKAPPYTVYLGNLSYECDEDDIVSFFLRKDLKVLPFPCSLKVSVWLLQVREVRLPTDSGTSRLKGFGYAELESVSSLLDALELTGEVMQRPHPPAHNSSCVLDAEEPCSHH